MKIFVAALLLIAAVSAFPSLSWANGKCGDNACQGDDGKCYPKEKHVSCGRSV